MLVACRLAGLSALGAHYAGVGARTQFGASLRNALALCGNPSTFPGAIGGRFAGFRRTSDPRYAASVVADVVHDARKNLREMTQNLLKLRPTYGLITYTIQLTT